MSREECLSICPLVTANTILNSLWVALHHFILSKWQKKMSAYTTTINCKLMKTHCGPDAGSNDRQNMYVQILRNLQVKNVTL